MDQVRGGLSEEPGNCNLSPVEIPSGKSRPKRDYQVQKSFLQAAPRHRAGVVEVARNHRSRNQHQEHDELPGKRKINQRAGHVGNDKQQADAPGLALGKLAVNGERASLVTGHPVPHGKQQKAGQSAAAEVVKQPDKKCQIPVEQVKNPGNHENASVRWQKCDRKGHCSMMIVRKVYHRRGLKTISSAYKIND